MSEQNKQAVQRLYDEFVSQGSDAALDELVVEDVIENEELPADVPEGREAVRAMFGMFREAFPDLKAEVITMVAEGDRVVAHGAFSGTQEGEWMGVPSSGKSFRSEVMDMFRFEDGKIAEHWGVMDQMGMMVQLGAIPDPSAQG